MEEHWKKLRRRTYGKTEKDGKAWLFNDSLKTETS
jgi:hypothetical protein